jgi:PKD repeat protein
VIGIPPGCQAEFTSQYDSLTSTGLVYFYDQSIGNITSWSWNFGDPASGANNTSTIQHPVHQFSSSGYYTVCLTVQGADPSCQDMTCHYIQVYIGPDCEANFTWTYDPSVAGFNTVLFTDLSSGNPTSWLWSFGDGTSGTVQNPSHTYAAPGVYPVTLTISGDSCTSSYTTNVTVMDSTSYHQLYGQVFAGQFPVDLAVMVLFSIDSTGNAPVYVSTADSSGVFYFTLIPDGNYYLLAIPFDSNGYLPTYYGNTISWEQATVIALGEPNNPYNINLVLGDQLISGGGSASGQINMGGLKSSMLDKVNMIVLNENMEPLDFTQVSSEGDFEFPSMAYGTYYLHPEMAGINSDYVKIVLSEAKPHAEVVMTFTGNSILGLGDKGTLYDRWTVYPNPFAGDITLDIQMKEQMNAVVRLFDMRGSTVVSAGILLERGSNTVTLPTAGLGDGVYFLQIISKEGLNISTKLIRTR